MVSCQHVDILKICEIIHDEKRIKEFICEKCSEIFSPCLDNEQLAKTPDHINQCNSCNIRKKKTKFRIVKDDWQEKLRAISNAFSLEENQKKRMAG